MPAHVAVAYRLTPLFEKTDSISSKELFAICDAVYSGTQAEGAYQVKDAYDALEFAVNRHLLSIADSWTDEDPSSTLILLDALTKRLPTQSNRTAESEAYHQFSTPPHLAYLAAWSAGITPSDVVLEPSAGTGSLAIFAKAWGAAVHVNELSDRRHGILKDFGFDGLYHENAEQLDNILPEAVKPSIILMNPPFSVAPGRMQKNDTKYITTHIEQALVRLQQGGRLVAILGQGMADDKPKFKDWWAEIKVQHNVRANLSIDGSNIRKYGTTFGVQLVIIDKSGGTELPTLTGSYTLLTDTVEKLEDIRNEHIHGNEQHTARPDNQALASPVDGGVHLPLPSPAAGTRPDHDRRDGNQPDRAGAEPAGRTHSPADAGSPGLAGGRAAGADGHASGRGGERSDPAGDAAGSRDGGHYGEYITLGQPVSGQAVTASEDEVYTAYRPAKVCIPGAQPHPADLVESAAMAAVQPPEPTYTPRLPQALADSGALSEAQLENIVYAGQAHAQLLPDVKRRGYFIGDGTGVGKGRQVAGIILDNLHQGRTKAIWISKNKSLTADAIRDVVDLGGKKEDILELGKIGYKPIEASQGVLFASFDTLKSKSKDGKDHISQIRAWVGEDFEGVLVFDEAHNMANAQDSKGGRGVKSASLKALAGMELQDTLPGARVVYASATGATDVKDFAYLSRLGLWGPGTAFADVNDFTSKIAAGGLAAMEVVARDMKAMGVYMARSISFSGVEYETLEHPLTSMQREIYDTCSRAWQTVLQNVDEALKATHQMKNPHARMAARSQFFGSMQAFYNQTLTSMAMPSVLADIRKELDAGHSCVLQIVNTNQAAVERAIVRAEAEKRSLDTLDITPSDALIGYLENSFPVHQYEEYQDDKGNVRSRMVTDSEGKPVLNRQMVEKRDALIEQIKQMKVPDGALEMLIDTFGAEQVAEVTGRTRRIVRKPDENGELHRVIEKRSSSHTAADVQAFQDGKKRILVFSDAGGTGKSYHADLRAANQQKRVHLLLQPGWNASAATQGFGRTHRSNQAQPPLFKLVTTDVKGQKRFISTIARRLDQLGALTKGQRQTGSSMFSAKDNLDMPLARDTLARFYRDLHGEFVPGIRGQAALQKMGLLEKLTGEFGTFNEGAAVLRDMNTFLNRILVLEIDEQNTVFETFYSRFEEAYEEAARTGRIDMGLEDYRADKVTVNKEDVMSTDANGAETRYLQLTAYNKPKIIGHGSVSAFKAGYEGFVLVDGKDIRAVYRLANKTLENGEVSAQYRLQSPMADKYSVFVEKTMQERTAPIEPNAVGALWQKAIAACPEYVETDLHLLTGALLPVWNRLPTENTRVMRVMTEEGQTYLGRLISEDQIDLVLRQFGKAARYEDITSEEIFTWVLEKRQTVYLQHDKLCLEPRRVSGETRIELGGDNLWYTARRLNDLIEETIRFEKRYFVPINDAGRCAVEKLITLNPVLRISSGQAAHMEEDEVSLPPIQPEHDYEMEV